MRNGVAAIAAVVLGLALALSQTQASFALANVDEAEHGVALSAVLPESSSRSSVAESVISPRRLLKGKASKSKSRRKTKWAAGQPTFLGVVITLSIIAALVVLYVVFLLITEKKKKDPKWRVRDLFKRRLKPGVKRTLTRRFTRKPASGEKMEEQVVKPKMEEEMEKPKMEEEMEKPMMGDEVEKPKVVEDGAPPKLQPVA